MLIGKIVTGGSKLSIYNWLCREKNICKMLGIDMKGRKVDHLYHSLGQLWLHQRKIEKKWFVYHKGADRRLFLYDVIHIVRLRRNICVILKIQMRFPDNWVHFTFF